MSFNRSYTCLPQQNMNLGRRGVNRVEFRKGIYQPKDAAEDAKFQELLETLSVQDRALIKTIDPKAAEEAIRELTNPTSQRGGMTSTHGVQAADPAAVALKALKNQITSPSIEAEKSGSNES